MKIFIQMSVAGFKIFDVCLFRHKCEKGLYAEIDEIASTQNGGENYRTHIIRGDMHGIRLETMSLFSSNDVTMLLHDDTYNGQATRCFYTNKYTLTKDKFNRDCDVSLCLMSENQEEIELINKFGYCFLVLQQHEVIDMLPNLLRHEIIGTEQVILFDYPLWSEICDRLKKFIPNTESPLCQNIANGNTQVVVLGANQDRTEVIRNMKNLFNCKQYLILNSQHLPLKDRTISASDCLSKMTIPPEHHAKEGLLLPSVVNDIKKFLVRIKTKQI